MINNVAMFTSSKKIKIKRQSLPNPKDNYVCVKFLYCSICGGDYSVFMGRRTEYPYSLGHEFVGKVIYIGNNVTKVKQGDIVVSDFNYRCNTCNFCKKSRSHLCDKNSIGLFTNRAFALFSNIHENYLYKINPIPYLPRACLIEPLSCVIHACNTIKVQPGMNILICGGGGIGSLFCFYITRIIKDVKIIVKEKNSNKIKLLQEAFNILPYEDNMNKQFNKFDYIIECTNSASGLKFCLDNSVRGSNLCIMSHLYGLDTSFVYDSICKKELNCKFPLRNGDSVNMKLAMEYIETYWTKNDDRLLEIHNNISEAFFSKSDSCFCKQVVKISELSF